MNPIIVLSILFAYFGLLIIIAFYTSKGANNGTFFNANKQSPWYLVAFGMIGASLSGVTFISIPGEVGVKQFAYFQLVLGYIIGYLVIGTVLLPLYYRLNLISIYTYLEQRFGFWAYKTGASFFLLSRVIGSALRLFLAANVLHIGVFQAWHVPFVVTVVITVALILVYTYKGGIKTIVWTDTLQTAFMLLAVVMSIFLIKKELGLDWQAMIGDIQTSKYGQIFFWDIQDKKYFWKQFLAGAFIAITMTGLDQDMMQKNLSCKNLKESQKNMFWFTITLVFVNLLFLALGALLFIYADAKHIPLPGRSDNVYPMLALQYFPQIIGILFVIGIIAAAYSSADSALAALTTSFCIDFLNIGKIKESKQKMTRQATHLSFALLFILVIIIFKEWNNENVVTAVFVSASYTYGPLLGLFAFGLFTKWQVKDKYIPLVCILSPVICYFLNLYSETLLYGYKFGFEILIVNGLFTFIGLSFLKKKALVQA